MRSVLVLSYGICLCTLLAAQEKKSGGSPDLHGVARDRVKGSIHHGRERAVWDRMVGKVKVIDANNIEFADGTRLDLNLVAPALEQKGMINGNPYPCGQEAARFLANLIGDRKVTCILLDEKMVMNAYVGDTNLEHAMIINGWALANHSSLHHAEIIARVNKRGLWRGEFVDPKDWLTGKRLPGEK